MATYCFSSNRIICVSLAICLSTWASPSEVDPRTFDERVEEGTAAVERGDWERAYEIALPYAEAGNIEAQWMVGLLLEGEEDDGFLGLSKDERLSEAFRWIATVAKRGHDLAARAVADSYENGWNGRVVEAVLAECWGRVANGEKKASECEVEIPAPLQKWRYEEARAEARALSEWRIAEEARAPRFPEMVVIAGGRFRMGCMNPPVGEADGEGPPPACPVEELPVREVTIRPFELSKHEVTFANWDACVAGGGCGGYRPDDHDWGRGNRPVIDVRWEHVLSYLSWLSRETGQCYRLPSEAEWEYAARAGSTTRYSWGNEIDQNQAHCGGCGSPGNTAPVGSFEPNAYGLYDMHGNVSEWVSDCWSDSHEGAPTDGSARDNDRCVKRVQRGGSRYSAPRYLRSASRVRVGYGGDDGTGFRVARALESSAQCDAGPSGADPQAPAEALAQLPEMVVIPAGQFRMGCRNPPWRAPEGSVAPPCPRDELPAPEVTIRYAFALSKYEVTFANWDACVAGDGCNGYQPEYYDWSWGMGRAGRPVVNVNWEDAQAYVTWLSDETGDRYRLPSEAEWEYAARAGSTTKYSWGDDVGRNRASCVDCGSRWDHSWAAPAGSFPANAFGLHDMHGNVFEWVQDCANDSHEDAPRDGSARERGTLMEGGVCSLRVVRGGSWSTNSVHLRSAHRRSMFPEVREPVIGFRVAQTLATE